MLTFLNVTWVEEQTEMGGARRSRAEHLRALLEALHCK